MSWKYYSNQTIPDTAPYRIIRRPVISEKATLVSQFAHYVFEVDARASKREIKQAVEKLYKVKALGVNTLRTPGKAKRFRGRKGYSPGYRKAIIRLEVGKTLDIGTSLT